MEIIHIQLVNAFRWSFLILLNRNEHIFIRKILDCVDRNFDVFSCLRLVLSRMTQLMMHENNNNKLMIYLGRAKSSPFFIALFVLKLKIFLDTKNTAELEK